MFCPRCGEEFIRRNATFYCERGDMELSAVLAAILANLCRENLGEKVLIDSNAYESDWFCPCCRHHLSRSAPNEVALRCELCGLQLDASTVFQIVELHSHNAEK